MRIGFGRLREGLACAKGQTKCFSRSLIFLLLFVSDKKKTSLQQTMPHALLVLMQATLEEVDISLLIEIVCSARRKHISLVIQ